MNQRQGRAEDETTPSTDQSAPLIRLEPGPVVCEHMQALLTNMFQRHWEWQEDRRIDLQPRFYRYNTAFGIRCGQAFSGVKDAHFDRSSRARGGSFHEGNSGRS